MDSTDPADQTIGQVRGEDSGQPGILAVLPPAVDHVVTLLKLLHDAGNILRIILEIRIQGNDDVPPGIIKSGGNGSGLPEIANKFQDTNPLIQGSQSLEFLGTPIGASIVDEENFAAGFPGDQTLVQTLVQGFEGLEFVKNGNDDGELKPGLRGLLDW
jgi:hypothetical protein